MGNLRQWGIACWDFAADNDRLLPRALMHTTGSYSNGWMLRREEDDPDNTPNWKLYGTTWETFNEYGIDSPLDQCPSWGNGAWTGETSAWGGLPSYAPNLSYDMQYTYFAGLSDNIPGAITSTDIGVASKAGDNNLSNKIIMADCVFWGGTTTWSANNSRYCHSSNDKNWFQNYGEIAPAYQSILFGDGHVVGEGADYYSQPLTIANADHHTTPSATSELYYWEGN